MAVTPATASSGFQVLAVLFGPTPPADLTFATVLFTKSTASKVLLALGSDMGT